MHRGWGESKEGKKGRQETEGAINNQTCFDYNDVLCFQ